MGQRVFLIYALILALSSATAHTYFAGAPIVLKAYGVGPESIGWFIMAVPLPYILGNALTSRIIHRYGDRHMMFWGQVDTVGGLFLMLVLAMAGVRSVLALVLPLVLMGFGHGLLVPPTLSGAVGSVPALAVQQLFGVSYLVGLLEHQSNLPLALLLLSMALCAWLAHAGLQRSGAWRSGAA